VSHVQLCRGTRVARDEVARQSCTCDIGVSLRAFSDLYVVDVGAVVSENVVERFLVERSICAHVVIQLVVGGLDLVSRGHHQVPRLHA